MTAAAERIELSRTRQPNPREIRAHRSSMVQQNSRTSFKVQRFLRFLRGGMVLLLAAWFGCGSSDGLNRQAISGIVTLDGQPISIGAILFEPATQESGTAVGATIRQGGSPSRAARACSGPVTECESIPARGSRLPQPTARPTVRLARWSNGCRLATIPKPSFAPTVLGQQRNQYRFDLNSSGPTDLR